MNFDINSTWASVKDGIKETAEIAHEKTSEFHENYLSKVLPDCGKYGDEAKFVAEMVPGVAEYNAIKDGDWTAFAIAAGIDVAAIAVAAVTAGTGYAAAKGAGTAAKAGVRVAAKELAEAGAETVIKEAVEASVKTAAKEAVETGVETAVKETVEAGAEVAIKEAVEAGAEKAVKETAENVAEKAVKESVEAGAETAAKETAENTTETAAKEAVEKLREGGSYRDVKKACDGTTHEVHHIPAKSASYLDELDGPAIKMEKLDHQKTASWGNSLDARDYRKAQQELIENGNFMDAIKMDIEDITSKFPGKYDNAISEVLEYVDNLKLGGII